MMLNDESVLAESPALPHKGLLRADNQPAERGPIYRTFIAQNMQQKWKLPEQSRASLLANLKWEATLDNEQFVSRNPCAGMREAH